MGNSIREESVENTLKLADKLFRKLLPTIPQELLQLDVTMSQMKIMLALFINGPTRMSDLASYFQVALATATGLVDRLVEKGMVVRESHADDRRVVLCRLSDSGQKTISGIWESARNNVRHILHTVDTEKLQMLTEALEALLQSAESTNR